MKSTLADGTPREVDPVEHAVADVGAHRHARAGSPGCGRSSPARCRCTRSDRHLGARRWLNLPPPHPSSSTSTSAPKIGRDQIDQVVGELRSAPFLAERVDAQVELGVAFPIARIRRPRVAQRLDRSDPSRHAEAIRKSARTSAASIEPRVSDRSPIHAAARTRPGLPGCGPAANSTTRQRGHRFASSHSGAHERRAPIGVDNAPVARLSELSRVPPATPVQRGRDLAALLGERGRRARRRTRPTSDPCVVQTRCPPGRMIAMHLVEPPQAERGFEVRPDRDRADRSSDRSSRSSGGCVAADEELRSRGRLSAAHAIAG